MPVLMCPRFWTRCERATNRVGELSSLLEDMKAQVAVLEDEVHHQKQQNVEVSRQLDISVNAVLTGERLIQQLMEDVKKTRAQCGDTERCVAEGDARIKAISQEMERVASGECTDATPLQQYRVLSHGLW